MAELPGRDQPLGDDGDMRMTSIGADQRHSPGDRFHRSFQCLEIAGRIGEQQSGKVLGRIVAVALYEQLAMSDCRDPVRARLI